MSEVLWQKKGVRIDARIMRFLAGDDVLHDRELFPFDIRATIAHVEGLAKIGLFKSKEAAQVREVLEQLARQFVAGEFILDRRFEDGHSAIEDVVTEKLGDLGRKIHTGRSRNDQVLVATRLYLRAALGELASLCRDTAEICLQRATHEGQIPMPGYTHMQRAVVSSTGMWFAGFAESFIDNTEMALLSKHWIDANPLGTAAGFGVNLKLDRVFTSKALDFSRMHINPVSAQLSRGKFELQALTALSHALNDLRRLAWDLSLFTTAEFDFVNLPLEYTTGSSIMPNKRNPDVIELLRASASVVHGAMAELQTLLSLPSGYQRDLQFTKAPLIRALRQGLDAMSLLPELLSRFEWNAEKMRAAIEPSMYATDIAIEQAAMGTPFRLAYRAAADAQDNGRTPEESLAARMSPGASGDLMLAALRDRLLNITHD